MTLLFLLVAVLFSACLPVAAAEPVTLSAIRQKYDGAEFRAAADLLNRLKTEQRSVYDSLPFALMRARALHRAGDLALALDAYMEASQDPLLVRFTLLPLARLAAEQGDAALAVRSYQQYLTIKNVPDFPIVAREALEYCVRVKKPDAVRQTAEIVRHQYALPPSCRLLYRKVRIVLRDDPAQARAFYLDLHPQGTQGRYYQPGADRARYPGRQESWRSGKSVARKTGIPRLEF